MEPTIVERPEILLAGLSFFGDPFALSSGWTEENEIGRLWQRWMAFLTLHERQLPGTTEEGAMFEVHIEHPQTRAQGVYEVFVGVPVAAPTGLPVELVLKVLPATRYAVFTLHGAEITSDWHKLIYDEWLDASLYRVAYPYSFQHYDERFKGLDHIAESSLDVYIPVAVRE